MLWSAYIMVKACLTSGTKTTWIGLTVIFMVKGKVICITVPRLKVTFLLTHPLTPTQGCFFGNFALLLPFLWRKRVIFFFFFYSHWRSLIYKCKYSLFKAKPGSSEVYITVIQATNPLNDNNISTH